MALPLCDELNGADMSVISQELVPQSHNQSGKSDICFYRRRVALFIAGTWANDKGMTAMWKSLSHQSFKHL